MKELISQNKNYLEGLVFHPDIDKYLYYADSPKKNYEYDGIDKLCNIIVFSGNDSSGMNIYSQEEPSALYCSYEVIECDDISQIGKLPHYPRYRALNPYQRYFFLKFLMNPYEPADDCFKFLLLYCLERHLSENDESVIPVMQKLADCHGGKFKKAIERTLYRYQIWKNECSYPRNAPVFYNYTLYMNVHLPELLK